MVASSFCDDRKSALRARDNDEFCGHGPRPYLCLLPRYLQEPASGKFKMTTAGVDKIEVPLPFRPDLDLLQVYFQNW